MSLRDENPLVDSDLELIVTVFEKGMTVSQDADSVFVPFRREMSALVNFPKSIIDSIDSVPLPSEVEGSRDDIPDIIEPEVAAGEAGISIEDAEEDGNALEDWVLDCVPCVDEFARTLSAMNADFFKDLGDEWSDLLDDIWDKLNGLEDFLEDTDLTESFCDLGEALKDQCGPDLEKLLFILQSLLSRMQFEFNLDLSILDSFLMAVLSPIFNALASALDLIDSLALDPIRCVLDYIQYQINHGPQLAQQARQAIVDPIRRDAYEQRARMNMALRQNAIDSSVTPDSRTEAELAAERARLEETRAQQRQQRGQRMRSALDRANGAFDRTRDSLNFLDTFKEYIETGVGYLKDKKDWLLSMIEEFVSAGLGNWDDQMGFAKSKSDILSMISILKAMIDALKSGDISCGPDTGGLTPGDVRKIVGRWQHPAESLEIIVEDGNIITRRRPGEEVTTGGEGVDTVAEEIPNVVVRRPISSCLKKVTTNEAEQMQHWIRQLEQEV